MLYMVLKNEIEYIQYSHELRNNTFRQMKNSNIFVILVYMNDKQLALSGNTQQNCGQDVIVI